MGTLSIRYTEPLIMRFGAKTMLLPGMGLIAVGLVLFTQAPVDGSYVQHVLPPMILLGFGAGLSFPALMTLAMSGATQRGRRASPPASSTRRRRWAARSAWRSSRPCPRTRSDNLIADGEATASALTSGYHLAFLIGAALVVAAIVVAVDGAPAGGAGRGRGRGRERGWRPRRRPGLLRGRVARRRTGGAR